MNESAKLVQTLNEAIRADLNDFGTPSSWRFSDLGKCLRYQVQKRLGIGGAPFSDDTLSIFRLGNIIEDDILGVLGKRIVVLTRDINGKQVKVRVPEYDAAGSLDALAIIDGELVVLEVKSTRDRALSFGDLPYTTHARQAAAYAIFLGLVHAYVLYIGRDGSKRAFKLVASDYEQEIKKEWAELGAHWNKITDAMMTSLAGPFEGALPPKLPKVQATKTTKKGGVTTKTPFVYEIDGPWGKKGDPKYEYANECTRCPYSENCWGEASESGDTAP